MKEKRFIFYQIITSVLWVIWMCGWFIIQDIVIDMEFIGFLIWSITSIWYLLQLYLPMGLYVGKRRFLLQLLAFSSIQLATWLGIAMISPFFNPYLWLNLPILVVNAILIQVFIIIIHKNNKRKRKSDVIESRKEIIYYRFNFILFLEIFVVILMSYYLYYSYIDAFSFNIGPLLAHLSSHILLILSFYRYFKRRIIILFKKGKLSISQRNKKINIKKTIQSCPHCHKELKFLENDFPEDVSYVSCLYCSEKILKVDIIQVDTKKLISEHQDMMQHLNVETKKAPHTE